MVWRLVLDAYEEIGTPVSERVGELPWSKLCKRKTANPSEFPMLHIKGAQAKHLLPAVTLVCEKKASMGIPDNKTKLRLDKRENTSRFFQILEEHHLFLPEDAAKELLTCTTSALLSYCGLSRMAIQSGRRLYNVVPKHHYWYHAAVQANFQNPRCGWVFKDEDYVGRVARIAHSCTFGVHAANVGVPLMLKYREALAIRVTRRALWS